MDEITNEGFTRTINGIAKEVADTMAVKYANSINSVHYFALLPYRLNDPAVIKKFLGEDVINKVGYYKISITFQQEGGGQDHEDEFIYWINKQNYFIDYLAYSYLTEGGGMRFREAYNTRTINGLRIVDYINYKPLQAVSLESMGTSYEQGMLKEVSKIDLENVSINMN